MKHSIPIPIAIAIVLGACGGGDDAPDPDAAEPTRCVPVPGVPGERVTTTSGNVRGALDGATWAYKRIPYAAPPVGELRWRAPTAPACAEAELDATGFGPPCPQLVDGVYSGDEDCLQLNVWAPAAAASGGARPVMVWIHSGGNLFGSAVEPFYDGRRLAEAGDVVVVSINYRLAQLGFLAHPSLASSDGEGTYGLADQIAALRWVRDNIAAFGGDPENVTIFGESAGARDTCSLLATPGSAGLFHRALMQSGACKFLPTPATAEAQGVMVVTALGCDGAPDVGACLRGKPAETVIRALPGDVSSLSDAPYQPVIDGIVLLEQPESAIVGGRHHAVPFAIGANADETGNSAPPIATVAEYEALVRVQFPPAALADRVLQQYPATAFPTPRAAYVRLTTDLRFVCPAREIAKHADAAQSAPAFRYFFQYRASPLGAVHGLDVPFVFGTFDAIIVNGQPYQPNATDLALSAAIQRYWTTFARTGDPGGTPRWPAYDATDPVLVLDAAVSTTGGIRAGACDFWAPIYNSR